ncbi:MAG: hypothetical protein KIG91_02825, partial [Treponema sp.]|nr:hypothetical protein [Treponema sp.]
AVIMSAAEGIMASLGLYSIKFFDKKGGYESRRFFFLIFLRKSGGCPILIKGYRPLFDPCLTEME